MSNPSNTLYSIGSDEDLSDLIEGIEDFQESSDLNLYRRVTSSVFSRLTGSVLSCLSFAGGVTLTAVHGYFPPLIGRITNAFAPFVSGSSFYTFLRSVLPSEVMPRIRAEAIRLGIPLYFLLTLIYLNLAPEDDKDVERKEAVIATMFTLFGFEVAALVDSIFERTVPRLAEEIDDLLEEDVDEFEIEGDSKRENAKLRRYTLLDDNPKCLAFRIPWRFTIATGLLTGSFFVKQAQVEEFMVDFSAFYFGESLAMPLVNMLIYWGDTQEIKYEEALQDDASLEVPVKLRCWRMIKKLLAFSGPPAIALLFINSQPGTLAATGALHSIREEVQRNLFKHATCDKTIRIWEQSRNCSWTRSIDTTYRVMRYVVCIGGLSYFTYEVINSGDLVTRIAGLTFTASVIAGFVKNSVLINLCTRVESSRFRAHLSYVGSWSSEDLLGMNSLYLYLYSLSHFKIGSKYISDSTLRKAIITFIPWVGYGSSMGGDLARAEFNNPALLTSAEDWLMIANTWTFAHYLDGEFKM